MSRATLILSGQDMKAKAIAWIQQAPWNTRLELKAPRRSLPQNDRFWASVTDVADQLSWHGQKLTPADWRLVFLASLKQEMRLVPNIENNGFVNLGRSSSDLSKAEMTMLLHIIYEFGARHGVVFHDQRTEELA